MTITNTTAGFFGLNFAGNNNVVVNASYTSPWFDTLAAGFTTQWANYIAASAAPAGSTVTWQFQSANTINQSDATALTSTVSSLTGRYVRAVGTITKDDSSATNNPSIDSIAVNANSVGQSIMVEEGTINLLTANQSSAETDTTGFTTFGSVGAYNAGATILRDMSRAFHGSASLQVTTTSAINQQGAGVLYTTTVAAGTTLTFSTWVWAPAGITFVITAWDNTNGPNGGSTPQPSFVSTGGWQRVSVTITTGVASTNSLQLGVKTNAAQAITFYLDGLQLEQKAYPTSWILGGTTRNTEVTTIPATVVNKSAGTVIIRAYVDGDLLNSAPVGSYCLFDCGANLAQNRIALYANSSNQNVSALLYDSGSNLRFTSYAVSPYGTSPKWHTFAIRWDGVNFSLWYDGILRGTVATPSGSITALPANAFIGSFSNSTGYWNNLIDDVLISNRAMTDAELTAMTASGAVISGDYSTTYHLRCDNNLLHGESGYRLSNAVDLTNIGTIGGSNVVWTETEGFSTGAITATQVVNLNVAGGIIQKTGGVDGVFDASFMTTEFLAVGQNGFIQWSAVSAGNSKLIALAATNNSPTSNAYNWYNYGMYLKNSANIDIFEGGALKASNVTTYTTSDTFKIEVIDGVVKYYKNTTLLYTSLVASSTALFGAATFLNTNANIINMILGRYAKVDVDVSIDNGTTYVAATNGATIPGLTAGVSAAGKNLIFRQKIGSPNAANVNGTLDSVTVKIAQTTSTQDILIKPVFNKVVMTPTNLDHWQFENKAYKTSYIAGTRSAETLTIPNGIANSAIVNPASGSVVMRVYVDGDSAAATTAAQHFLFNIGDTGTNSITFQQTTGTPGTYRLVIKGSDGVPYVAGTTVRLSQGWHTFGIRWGGGSGQLFIDGVQAATVVVALPTVFSTATISIGCYQTGVLEWNSQIAQVDIFRENLTDAEMVAYTAASGAVIPTTAKHTYQMKLENNLNYASAGSWTSDWLDAGANAVNTPYVNFKYTQDVPAGTAIQYSFKASDTANDGAAFYTAITDPNLKGRFIKVRATLMSDDTINLTPSVSKIEPVAKFS